MMQLLNTNPSCLSESTVSQLSPFQKYMQKFMTSKRRKEGDDEENENDDDRNQTGLQKKIKKDKRQYIKAFQKSMEQKSIEVYKQTKFRQCSVYLPRPIVQLFHFLFSGFVPLEIPHSVNDQISNLPIKCESLEKQKNIFSTSQFSVEINNEFNLAIHLLESKQDTREYQFAQMLKQYQSLVQKQTIFLNSIKDKLMPDEKSVEDFLKQRGKFREECLSKYIAENMSENDYYFCFDVDIHQNDSFTCPSTVKISKSLFTLFGISDDEVSNFIVKQNGFPEMFPLKSRRMISILSLTLKLDEQSNSSFFQREFEFNTVDGIKLFCDVLATKCPIQYSPELQFPNYNSLPFGLEHFIIIKLFISNKQIESVQAQRQSNAQQAPKIFEDFEYSMVSSIFIEKFYPLEYQSQSKEYSKQDKKQFSNQELSKICKYKSINPVLRITA